VVRNNLGGAGPDGGEEGILFGGVMPGKDLLISAKSTYTPNMLNPSGGVLRNGAHQGFGVINMASGSSVDLEFTLKDSVTGADSPDSFVVTFFDGDHGMSHESREILTINGMSNYIVDDDTELEITKLQLMIQACPMVWALPPLQAPCVEPKRTIQFLQCHSLASKRSVQWRLTLRTSPNSPCLSQPQDT